MEMALVISLVTIFLQFMGNLVHMKKTEEVIVLKSL
jgi:hypothetical protein